MALGQIIPGTQYRVLARIGTGGMGTVYASEHVALEKRVALKVLRADVAHSPDAINRLRDEARAASKIGSQFICDVTDFGQTPDGRVFFVMEYLEGVSLGRVLRHNGPLPAARLIPILRQIAKALDEAHSKGIVHLDMKPDNVMLLPRGRRTDAVKVVDFGVARLLTGSRRDEKVAGTPEYVSPERFLGAAYDHRADIYALGVLAYECLTGKVPFRGTSYLATLTMHAQDPPVPIGETEAGKQVPGQLAALVMQMLEKDPSARPDSMAVVEAMLCEAQIAAGLRTDWDDLELPAVDDIWHKKLAERMPSPLGQKRKRLLAAAFAITAIAAAVALYYGVLRAPETKTIVKFVESTKTEEAAEVAVLLEKAQDAAKEQAYTEPPHRSALAYIQQAEKEHRRLNAESSTRSKGAAKLRQIYASTLELAGDDLRKGGLGHLAAYRYKQAMLFTPDDRQLASKAQLSAAEQARLRERARAAARPAPPAVAGRNARPDFADEAREHAASAYLLAAKRGQYSRARLELRALAAVDPEGRERAGLADAFRRDADRLWNSGAEEKAAPLYGLVSLLDPNDVGAKRKMAWEPPKEPIKAAEVKVQAVPAPEPVAKAPPKAKPVVTLAAVPRNPAQSRAAVKAGNAAVRELRLEQAETAFNRALEADPGNAVAVAGLAQVAFERSRYSDALTYARRAAMMDPRSTRFLLLLGDAYFKLLRFADAKATYERARKLAPNNEVIRGRLSRVMDKTGN